MALVKLFMFNSTLVVVGFFLCSWIDRTFGKGTIDAFWVIATVFCGVGLIVSGARQKHDKT